MHSSGSLTERARGAALLIVTLLLVVIFGLLALAIDFNMASAAKEQAQHYARLSALAALEQYVISSGGGAVDDALNTSSMAAALSRAQKVAEKNYMLTAPTASDKPILNTNGTDPGALLEPGIWAVDTANTWSAGKCTTTACFVKWSNRPPGFTRPNAMRVSGDLFPGGIRTRGFSAVIGGGAIASTVGAIASIVPRRGCFVVDLSSSMVRQTHSGNAEFAYFLRELNPQLNKPGTFWQRAPESLHDDRWAGLPPTRGGDTDPGVHYQDDYRYKLTLDNADHTIGGFTQGTYTYNYSAFHPNPATYPIRDSRSRRVGERAWYAVDSYGLTNNGSPEPLTSILTGLNQALQAFSNRRVPGDQACLIFFDQTLSWPRIVNLTSNFNYLLALTNTSIAGGGLVNDTGFTTPLDTDAVADGKISAAEWAAAEATLNSLDATTDGGLGDDALNAAGMNVPGWELLIKHGIFPGVLGNTNLIGAITEANNQLAAGAAGGAVASSSFIVLIGDSLGNCVNCGAGAADPGNVCPASAGTCVEEFEYYSTSTAEVEHLINKSGGLRESGIPLHFIAIGPEIMPHVVDRPITPGGRCLTDKEWRAGKRANGTPYHNGEPYGFVDTSSTTNSADGYEKRSTAKPFTWSNHNMYKWAVDTQGLWAPVRPPRLREDTDGDGVREKHEKCPDPVCDDAALDTDGDGVIDAGLDAGDLVVSGSLKLRIRDPQCREQGEQIRDYMAEIMGENPFSIVRVDQGGTYTYIPPAP
jgi:hypothetical protein